MSKKIITKLAPAKPTIAYDTYWKFAYERQNIFYRRQTSTEEPFTDDSILKEYKFTNVYRVCDRVSQYLVSNVIYNSENKYSPKDIFLRIMLFKLFNKIDTWILLEEKFGDISTTSFNVSKYRAFLDNEMNKGRTLYSNAYMMASGSKEFDVTRKHHAHLMLLEKMLKDKLMDKISSCTRMSDAYTLLLGYPLIGRFLAYQYITDLNYSELTNFSETEFTVPGPGARDGIRKCFSNLGGLTETEVIKMMCDRQDYEFERLGLDFKKIGSRPLQYIDIQNI